MDAKCVIILLLNACSMHCYFNYVCMQYVILLYCELAIFIIILILWVYAICVIILLLSACNIHNDVCMQYV